MLQEESYLQEIAREQSTEIQVDTEPDTEHEDHSAAVSFLSLHRCIAHVPGMYGMDFTALDDTLTRPSVRPSLCNVQVHFSDRLTEFIKHTCGWIAEWLNSILKIQ